nr:MULTISPECIES: SDR family oxidoreductase [unclassified Paraburkholderia]
MAVEYAPHCIRVNCLIEPNDVAMTALHLASDEWKTTTSQIFPIDGGFSIS